jgi:hypothetical protein
MGVDHNYVSRHFDENDKRYFKAIYELERQRINLYELLHESVSMDFLGYDDAKKLEDFYKKYRIPLGHGLRTKGLYEDCFPENIFQFLALNEKDTTPVSWKTMENIIEDEGIDVIFEILEILIK